jgi:hypothetical protein
MVVTVVTFVQLHFSLVWSTVQIGLAADQIELLTQQSQVATPSKFTQLHVEFAISKAGYLTGLLRSIKWVPRQ